MSRWKQPYSIQNHLTDIFLNCKSLKVVKWCHFLFYFFFQTLSYFYSLMHLNPFKQVSLVFTGDLLLPHSKRALSVEPRRKSPVTRQPNTPWNTVKEKCINWLLKRWYDGTNLMAQQIGISCNWKANARLLKRKGLRMAINLVQGKY